VQEQSIFLEALDRQQPAERAAFLDQACAGDSALRQRIELLLHQHGQSRCFLDSPVLDATVDEPPVGEGPGTVIGPYKLLEQIGEGGFGVVFLAEQTQPVRRKVALKVLKPGMDMRQVVARFEAERQALAIMDHPHIAKVFDGGATPSGRPYFVMELVKGVPITEFCDQHHFTPRQRLGLFVPVCQAVQHAHQKGIIHRDLKPSNVLVSRHDLTPVVKVIDFGVAKALGQELTDKTLCTGVAQMVGTPLYMSPEQAGMSDLDIDTRSDVYSLGVLLYELLTGTTPFTKERFKRAAYDEMRRIIREEEPPKPSTRLSESKDSLPSISAQRQMEPAKLTKLVRGELDWIVMKALEKDRGRRYESANGFALDVQRYLADESVQACPPSAGYLLRKFTRQHKTALALAGLILFFIALLAGGGGWVARDRSLRRDRAVEEARAARADVERLRRAGNWTAALAVARSADTLLASETTDPGLRRQFTDLVRDLEMAVQLEDIRIRKSELRDNHFDEPGADPSFARAFRDFQIDVELLETAEAAARIRARTIPEELVAALDDWASIRERTDVQSGKRLRAVAREADPDPWRNRLREALDRRERKTLEELAASEQVDTWPPSTVMLLARALVTTKAEAVALAVLRRAQWLRPDDFWVNDELGFRLHVSKPRRLEEAIVFYRLATALRPRSALVYLNLGSAFRDRGRLTEAAEAYGRAILLEPGFATAHFELGRFFHYQQKKLPEAIEAYQRSIELKPDFSAAYSDLGQALWSQGRLTEAEAAHRRAVQIAPGSYFAQRGLFTCVALQRRQMPEAEAAYRREIELNPGSAWPYLGLATFLRGRRRPEAVDAYQSAIRVLEAWLAKEPESRGAWWGLLEAYGARAATLSELGRYTEAIQDWGRMIAFDPENENGWSSRAFTYIEAGQFDKAVADYEHALKLDPKDSGSLNNLAELLANCPDPTVRNPQRAIALARRAVDEYAEFGTSWNTLGAALYRGGVWQEAVAALEKSVELHKGGMHSDHFLLAMAQWRLGRTAEARTSYDRGVQWMEKHAPKNEELRRFRAEARELMATPRQ
jgi:serine/threonine protein kinase/tetratricopeptide (TPR) repeat protein